MTEPREVAREILRPFMVSSSLQEANEHPERIHQRKEQLAKAVAQALIEARQDAMEEAAKIAESKMNCGCGRADCYTDRIPESIAAAIRRQAQEIK